jgi:hypothetical protein
MDEPLEIPDAAYATCSVVCTKHKATAYNTVMAIDVIKTTAPLIVAAAYRTRAQECNCMHDVALLNWSADELDQQGLTK